MRRAPDARGSQPRTPSACHMRPVTAITARCTVHCSCTVCAYCNKNASVAGKGDHVIPRCVFEFQSQSTIRVPACRPCNLQKSQDEDYVRDWLCAHIDVDQSAVPSKVYDRFMGSAKRGKFGSAIARAAMTEGRYEPRFTASGLYAGIEFAYPFDAIRVVKTFERGAQGLYYAAQQQHLVGGGQFGVGEVPRPHIEDQIKLFQRLGATGPHALGGRLCHVLFASERTSTYIAARVLVTFYNDSVAVDAGYQKPLP